MDEINKKLKNGFQRTIMAVKLSIKKCFKCNNSSNKCQKQHFHTDFTHVQTIFLLFLGNLKAFASNELLADDNKCSAKLQRAEEASKVDCPIVVFYLSQL